MDSTVRASDKGSSWESEGSALAPVREGDTVSGKYQCEGVIGVGGMGVVVTARDRFLERKVAIKFLLPRFVSSEVAVQRFIREARAATRITSEHVVKLLEIDRLPNGVPFLVMEYLEGRDLKAVLTDSGPLPPRQAVDYILQAAQAVAEGHLKGIIHRDLKPSNLFVAQRADGTPLIKVLDFGIAKTLEQESFDAGLTGSDDTRLGTPAYMPPEQLQSPKDVDARSDVWGLGVTLYELLSNRLPFSAESFADLVFQITRGQPHPLETGRSGDGLPDGLEAAILRCLEKTRELRYSSVLELVVALAQYGSEEAITSLRRVRGLGASVPPTRQDAPEVALTPSTTLMAEVPSSEPVSQRRSRLLPAAIALGSLVALALIASFIVPSRAGSSGSESAARNGEASIQATSPPAGGSSLVETAKLAESTALTGTLTAESKGPTTRASAAASARAKPTVKGRPLVHASAPPPSASAEATPSQTTPRTIEELIGSRR